MPAALLFLVQALILVAGPYLLWRLPRVRGVLPLVVVQILFGIALGPSMLGAFVPTVAAALFPPASLAQLQGLATLAVVFFGFLTGLHVDVAEIRGKSLSFLSISLSSLVVPTLAGVAVGFAIIAAEPAMAGPRATPMLFAAGLGICIGVTALPVLGAILRELGLLEDRLGRLALGCAAVNDALLWVMVAALLGVVATSHGPGILVQSVVGAAWYGGLTLGVRPTLARWFARTRPHGGLDEMGVVLVCALLLGSAIVTEAIGLHYLIGAFVAGTVIPKRLAGDILAKLEPFAVLVLLPFFFTLTGLKVDLELSSGAQFAVFAVATAATVAGKMLGTAVPARLAGETWRCSLALGALLQCKGLMEVIVLTVLLDAGILSGAAFSALVLMAVATTAATKPLTLLLRPAKTPIGRTGSFD
ncbi:MAG TPA: cation:proton antiporter [Azospirillaceae bacterium]|nr:cation:proton antiporter [Azospirillaceae bacterium]